MSKEHVSSGNARSCCEAGEERFAEGAVPTVDQMKQAARGAQDLPALLTAVFMRGDRAHKPVHRGERIVLAPELLACLQGDGLSAEKEHQPPQRGTVQRPLVDLLLALRRDVADHPAVGRYGLLIRQLILLQIVTRQGQQAYAGVAPIGQQETQANR